MTPASISTKESMEKTWINVLRSAPTALWVLYFFNAFLNAFPMIAQTDWLNNYIGMPIATQSQFYAFIFIPDCLKPFFAFIANAASEHRYIRGRSRALLLQICGVASGLLYVSTLRVNSILGAFVVFFAINIFNSCAELMLGAYLMETAHNDMKNVGAIQSLAGGARALGSIVAAITNVLLYPCDSSKGVPSSRSILAYSGMIAAINFAFSFLLPDATSEFLLPLPLKQSEESEEPQDDPKRSEEPTQQPLESTQTEDDDTSSLCQAVYSCYCCLEHHHTDSVTNNLNSSESFSDSGGSYLRMNNDPKEQENNDTNTTIEDGVVISLEKAGEGKHQFRLVLEIMMLIIIIQAFLVWISVKDFLSNQIFYIVLSVISLCMLFSMGWLHYGFRADTATALKYGLPAVFLFIYNAMPSSQEQIFTYQFYLFFESSPCKITQLNLISSGATVFSFIVYGLACNQRGIRSIIIVTTIASLLLGLLWLPLASLNLNDGDDMNPSKGECIQFISSTSCLTSPFVYAALVQFITGVSSMLAFTPSTVLATESTPFEHKTMAYAIFLSVIDSGSSASGWITSSIVTKLGITYDSWGSLSELIWIATLCQFTALIIVPFLKDAPIQKVPERDSSSSTSVDTVNGEGTTSPLLVDGTQGTESSESIEDSNPLQVQESQ